MHKCRCIRHKNDVCGGKMKNRKTAGENSRFCQCYYGTERRYLWLRTRRDAIRCVQSRCAAVACAVGDGWGVPGGHYDGQLVRVEKVEKYLAFW